MILKKTLFFEFLFALTYFYCFSIENSVNVCVISLGPNCETGMMKKHLGFNGAHFPFDFLTSGDFNVVCELIENGFQDFINVDFLTIVSTNKETGISRVKHKKYPGIVFVHDFSLSRPIEKYYIEIYNTYQRRIDRFYQALTSNNHVFFFRRYLTKEQAVMFCDLITMVWPNLCYTLVAINDVKLVNFNLPHVYNAYIKKREYYEWNDQESIDEWLSVYKVLGIL